MEVLTHLDLDLLTYLLTGGGGRLRVGECIFIFICMMGNKHPYPNFYKHRYRYHYFPI